MPTKSNPRYDEILRDLKNQTAGLLIPWGGESLTQCVGRAAHAVGAEGLLAASASVRGGTNIAYFPDRRRTGSLVVLCDAAGIAAMLKSRRR